VSEVLTADLVVVGAGPAGLYATYYAGFRGMSVVVVDALAQPGGQMTALYPEKPVFDVAGFPRVRAQDLVDGGGDSAVDWALVLEPLAASVTVAHRRDAFRAHEHSVAQLRASSVRLLTPFEVSAVRGGDTVAEVDLLGPAGGLTVAVDEVVAALGFQADLKALAGWGIELTGRHIPVDRSMRTNRARVFAAGDITDFPGKVRLISVGFGEAALAVNNLAPLVRPDLAVVPGHSSDSA
jgi:thioredoxin reductase